jgi:hypothetical protein
MGRHGEGIHAEFFRTAANLAERLHRVRMEEHSPLPADRGEISDRLDDARLVVGKHDRHQNGLLPESRRKGFPVDETPRIHTHFREAEPLIAGKCSHRMKHGVMLRGNRDEMIPAGGTVAASHSKDGKIAALRTSAREDDSVGFHTEQAGDPITRPVDHRPGPARGGMHPRGIPPDSLLQRSHRLARLGAERGGGVVIKIDHEAMIPRDPRHGNTRKQEFSEEISLGAIPLPLEKSCPSMKKDMTPSTILPDLQAAILCEDVRAEISGQQTLVGVLGAIPTPTLPIGFFKLCLWTRWCGGSGDFIQKCLIYDPEEDQAIAQAEVPFSLSDLNAHATNVHFFGGVQFQKYGNYHVEILVDDELRLRIPLPVIKVEAPGEFGGFQGNR